MLHLKNNQNKMKKLLILLMLTFSFASYGQAEFEKIAITENTTSTTALKINVQEANGEVNTMAPENLPLSVIPPVTHFTPLSSNIKGYFQGVDDALNTLSASATEAVRGLVQLATAAETTAGLINTKAVHPAGLKVELDKKATLNSPTFTNITSLAANPVGSSPNIFKQMMAGTDYWTIYGESTVSDRGKMVFELGDNATSVSVDGEAFEFRYTDAITPSWNKTVLSIDYNATVLGTPLTINSSGELKLNGTGGSNSIIKMFGSAVGSNNFNIVLGVSGVSNSGFSIRDESNAANRFVINSSGVIGVPNLAGSGDRAIGANSSGELVVLGAQPKKYTALLTQTGTSAPVATILENTLGGTVVWSRNNTGNYFATCNSCAFPDGKTYLSATTSVHPVLIEASFQSTTIVAFVTAVTNTGVLTDGVLNKSSIEIRVYP